MDGARFDSLSRALVDARSRRGLARLLGTLTLGGILTAGTIPTAAKKGGKGKGKGKNKKGKKVTICHNGQTITVSKSALKGHKKHGDSEGPCPPCVPRCATTNPCGADGCGSSCSTCGGSTTCQNGQCRCPDGRSPCGPNAVCCTGEDICLSSGACGPCVGIFSTFPSSPDGSTCGTSADCCQTDAEGNPAEIRCASDDVGDRTCAVPVGG